MKTAILSLFLIALSAVGVDAQTDIQRVDFKNFTYRPYCVDQDTEKVTVKNGEFSSEKQEDGFIDRFYFKAYDAEYGDLNGDGKDEAVVLTVCNTGGTGNFSEGFIFSMKNNKPFLLARIPGGDRADGGLRSAIVEAGLLVVESNDPSETGGSCCPEFALTNRYKLSGGKLIVAGKTERRELYPKQRVSFPKGSSGTTFKTIVPAGELKRFVVGARSGQTLTASISRKDVSIRLIEDAEVTEGINNFLARLPQNGDYTIELQNLADTDLEVTINIKIR
jgi:hypothetical protein